jgi:Cu(I)/Ag(I) efflux system membrane fusion protein
MRFLAVLLMVLIVADAKILEVKQLFNKKIVKVQKRVTTGTKKLYATTAVDESRVFDIALRFSGFIIDLKADKRYMRVHKGEELFSIYSDTLSNIKEELRLSSNQFVRNSLKKRLQLLGISSTIKSDYSVSITSPTEGYIIKKSINKGSFLKKGELALQIADFSRIWVIAKAYQKDLGTLQIGDDVVVDVGGVGRYRSKIDYIYPNIDPKTKTFDVRVVLKNQDHKLFPNLFATIFVSSNKRSMLILPKSAVLNKGKKHFVFIPLKDGEFEPKEIEAKRIDSKMYEIVSGLKEGDEVIDNALFLLDSDAITNGLYDSDDDW